MKWIIAIIISISIIFMADYGFRIAEEGQDVKTCTDLKTVVNSKYANLKGSISGSGSKLIPNADPYQTVTIAHGLGYIPTVRLLVDMGDGSTYTDTPYIDNTAFTERNYKARADATNVYLDFYFLDYGGSDITVYYKYFIFIDKAKL